MPIGDGSSTEEPKFSNAFPSLKIVYTLIKKTVVFLRVWLSQTKHYNVNGDGKVRGSNFSENFRYHYVNL